MATWLVVAGLGAYHGLNPAMGWLFAVALGLQEQRGSAVLRAIPPLAAGHALSVGAVALLAVAASVVVPAHVLRAGGGGALLAFAALLLVRRSRHPRGTGIGMRAGARQLTTWSLIMASAHGSGLMLLPVLLATGDAAADVSSVAEPAGAGAHAAHLSAVHVLAARDIARAGSHAVAVAGFSDALLILAVHTGAMLVALAAAALLTYGVLGLGFLRRAWINLDVIWIGSLVVAGVTTLLG